MRYKDFIESKNQKRKIMKDKLTVINSKDLGKGILNVIKTLGKIGLGVVKIVFRVVGGTLMAIFWVMNEGITFIAHKLQICFYKLDEDKQDEVIKKMVATALITIVGGGIMFTNLSNKVKILENVKQTIALSASQEKSDTQKIDVEIVDNSKETKTKEETTNKNESSKSSSNVIDKDNLVGSIAIKSTIGSVDPGHLGTTKIRYEDSGKKIIKEVDTYGIGEFTTVKGKRYAKDFTDFIKEVDEDFYNEYFDGVGKPGTTTFTTGWYNASKTEADKFTQLQFKYLYNTYIEPTVNAIKEEYDINLMSSKALQEFIFSTANQYGKKGTLTLFEKAEINSSMTEKEIIEAIQQEKIDSLGIYTYTDNWGYNDEDRENYKTRAEEELKQFLDLL